MLADRIGDRSKGYLCGGMGGGIDNGDLGRAGGVAVAGIPALNLGGMGIGYDGGTGMSGWG